MEVGIKSRYNFTLMIRGGATIIAALFFSVLPAFADLEVKKAVFTDCKVALEQSAKLNEDERRDLVQYLTEVLRLSTSKPRIPSGILARPGVTGELPFEDHRGEDLWRSFDPAREVEAKRCAVEMLGTLTPASVDSLPDLAALTIDRATPLDLSSLIEQKAIDIANGFETSFQGAISVEALNKLFIMSMDQEGGVAQNLLVSLHRVSLPYLLRELRLPDANRRDHIVKTLLLLERGGSQVGQGFVDLLTTADDGLRKRALGAILSLPSFYSEALIPLTRRLSDVSPSVSSEAARVLSQIAKSGAAIFPIKDAASTSEELFKAFRRVSDIDREELVPALALIGWYGLSNLEERMLHFTSENEDEGIRMRAFKVLGRIPILSDRGFEAMIRGLSDEAPGVQGSALEALSGKDERAGEIVTAIEKVLAKRTPSLARPMLLLYMADVVESFGTEAKYESLLPYLIEALSIDYRDPTSSNGSITSNSVNRAIIRLGKKSVPSLIKTFKNDSQVVRSRVAFLLGEVGKGDLMAINALVEKLGDPSPSVSEASYRALISIGPEVIARAKKAKLSPRTARLITELGEANPSYLPVLLRSATQGLCTERPLYTRVVVKGFGSQSDALVNALLECISQIPGGDARLVESLEALGPVSRESAAKIGEVLRDRSRVDDTLALLILEKGRAIGLDDETIIERASWLLENAETPIKLRILAVFTSLGPSAKSTIPILVKIRDDSSIDYLLRYRAGVAAVSIDPALMVESRLVVEELGSDRSEWAEKALLAIPVENAKPVLEASLSDEGARLSALEVIGRLGERAIALVPSVRKVLLETKDPKVRYAASVTLLRVVPEEGENILRRELVGRYARELIEEKFSPKLKSSITRIVETPFSFVEKAYATSMLYKSHNN